MLHLFSMPAPDRWLTLLAQQSQTAHQTSSSASLDILKWLGVIVAAAVVLVITALVLRRVLLGDGDQGGQPGGFTLSDLRQMHARGQMSDEEFQTTKAAMFGHLAASQPEAENQHPARRPPSHHATDEPEADPDQENSDDSSGSDENQQSPGQ